MQVITKASLLSRVRSYLEEARTVEPHDPTAVSLATVEESRPSVRVVLLKGIDKDGLVFYTNYESRKARQLAANPNAAICAYFPTLGIQIRAEGQVEMVSEAESDAYFSSRPRESQLGAWASRQSQPLPERQVLLDRYAEMEARFGGHPEVPRPSFWGGYRLMPERLEIWKNGAHRLHERTLFVLDKEVDIYREELLYP